MLNINDTQLAELNIQKSLNTVTVTVVNQALINSYTDYSTHSTYI